MITVAPKYHPIIIHFQQLNKQQHHTINNKVAEHQQKTFVFVITYSTLFPNHPFHITKKWEVTFLYPKDSL